jgi:hypothetical protein
MSGPDLPLNGFFVIQAPDPEFGLWNTEEEGPRAMAIYEGAVDYLVQKGLTDNQIGLIGFSRTCFYVKYTLTRSTRVFGAVSVADGVDGGYFQYLALSNYQPTLATQFEGLNGGPPFGNGLNTWIAHVGSENSDPHHSGNSGPSGDSQKG